MRANASLEIGVLGLFKRYILCIGQSSKCRTHRPEKVIHPADTVRECRFKTLIKGSPPPNVAATGLWGLEVKPTQQQQLMLMLLLLLWMLWMLLLLQLLPLPLVLV